MRALWGVPVAVWVLIALHAGAVCAGECSFCNGFDALPTYNGPACNCSHTLNITVPTAQIATTEMFILGDLNVFANSILELYNGDQLTNSQPQEFALHVAGDIYIGPGASLRFRHLRLLYCGFLHLYGLMDGGGRGYVGASRESSATAASCPPAQYQTGGISDYEGGGGGGQHFGVGGTSSSSAGSGEQYDIEDPDSSVFSPGCGGGFGSFGDGGYGGGKLFIWGGSIQIEPNGYVNVSGGDGMGGGGAGAGGAIQGSFTGNFGAPYHSFIANGGNAYISSSLRGGGGGGGRIAMYTSTTAVNEVAAADGGVGATLGLNGRQDVFSPVFKTRPPECNTFGQGTSGTAVTQGGTQDLTSDTSTTSTTGASSGNPTTASLSTTGSSSGASSTSAGSSSSAGSATGSATSTTGASSASATTTTSTTGLPGGPGPTASGGATTTPSSASATASSPSSGEGTTTSQTDSLVAAPTPPPASNSLMFPLIYAGIALFVIIVFIIGYVTWRRGTKGDTSKNKKKGSPKKSPSEEELGQNPVFHFTEDSLDSVTTVPVFGADSLASVAVGTRANPGVRSIPAPTASPPAAPAPVQSSEKAMRTSLVPAAVAAPPPQPAHPPPPAVQSTMTTTTTTTAIDESTRRGSKMLPPTTTVTEPTIRSELPAESTVRTTLQSSSASTVADENTMRSTLSEATVRTSISVPKDPDNNKAPLNERTVRNSLGPGAAPSEDTMRGAALSEQTIRGISGSNAGGSVPVAQPALTETTIRGVVLAATDEKTVRGVLPASTPGAFTMSPTGGNAPAEAMPEATIRGGLTADAPTVMRVALPSNDAETTVRSAL